MISISQDREFDELKELICSYVDGNNDFDEKSSGRFTSHIVGFSKESVLVASLRESLTEENLSEMIKYDHDFGKSRLVVLARGDDNTELVDGEKMVIGIQIATNGSCSVFAQFVDKVRGSDSVAGCVAMICGSCITLEGTTEKEAKAIARTLTTLTIEELEPAERCLMFTGFIGDKQVGVLVTRESVQLGCCSQITRGDSN